mgnify:CR=1 FL=1
MVTSVDGIASILLTVKWEKVVAKALTHTVKSVASIKNEKPHALPPRVFRHYINISLLKYVFGAVASYFSLPQSYRLSVHLFAKMLFYRIDEIPRELWIDYLALMIRVGMIKFKLPEQVARVVAIMAAQLRLALEDCYDMLLELGELLAERYGLLKRD